MVTLPVPVPLAWVRTLAPVMLSWSCLNDWRMGAFGPNLAKNPSLTSISWSTSPLGTVRSSSVSQNSLHRFRFVSRDVGLRAGFGLAMRANIVVTFRQREGQDGFACPSPHGWGGTRWIDWDR